MIRKIECFIPVCNNCGKDIEYGADFLPHYATEAEALSPSVLNNADAEIVGGALCCSRCWRYDEDDNPVIVAANYK